MIKVMGLKNISAVSAYKGQLISKGLLVSSILPNNEQKQVDLRYHSIVG